MTSTVFQRARVALFLPALALAVLAIAGASAPSWADAGSEAFVRNNVQRGLTILNNHGISDTQRRTQFRDFLTSLTDIHRIAMFTLGGARRTASPQEQEQFASAFREYAVAVYESRLTAYAGQSLRVTGSTEHAPGDDIVTTVLVDPTGKTSNQGEPIEVDFRVENENGHYVVIDASIAGVWLGLEERDQFTAFLQENHDSVPALISHLNALTQRLRSGGANTPTH